MKDKTRSVNFSSMDALCHACKARNLNLTDLEILVELPYSSLHWSGPNVACDSKPAGQKTSEIPWRWPRFEFWCSTCAHSLHQSKPNLTWEMGPILYSVVTYFIGRCILLCLCGNKPQILLNLQFWGLLYPSLSRVSKWICSTSQQQPSTSTSSLCQQPRLHCSTDKN